MATFNIVVALSPVTSTGERISVWAAGRKGAGVVLPLPEADVGTGRRGSHSPTPGTRGSNR